MKNEKPNSSQGASQNGNKAGNKVSAQLGALAKKKILSLCVGNGFGKDDIAISNINGRILKFEARTIVRPDVEAQIHTQTGRVKGDKTFKSREALDKELEKLKDTLSDNDKLIEKIIGQIRKRKDKGIGIKGEAVNLKTLDQSYVAHETCTTCQSSGSTTCPKCHGHKTITCVRCHGRTMVQCVVCNGRTTIAGADGKQQTCPRCQGRAQIPCDYCKGAGKTTCDQCQGSGGITCQSCKGAGVNSQVAQIKMTATIDGAFIIEDLPDDIASRIAQTGPDLVTDRLAKIKSMTKDKTEDNLTELRYVLSMPYGEMDLNFSSKAKPGKENGQSDIKARLIGYNPRFIEMPPVLDQGLESLIKHIGSSAAQFAPLKTLQKAGKYKIFREAMTLTAQGSVNAAKEKLDAKYEPFISPSNTEQIALRTNGLLNKATEKPKKLANWCVSTLMLILFGGYFLGPGQAYLNTAIRDIPVLSQYADFASWGVLAMALLLTGPIHQLFSRAIFKSKIGKLLPGSYTIALMRKLKHFSITPYVLTLLAFSLFYVGVEILDFRL